METTAKQVEKNVSASFAYVKKDILMLNDSYTSMQDAISQMADSYKVLAEEIKQIKKDINKSPERPVIKTSKKTITKTKTKDKLSLIEGIGPVIEQLLRKNKIDTFKQLSNKKSSDIRKILDKAGTKFQMHDPTTWAKQAKLASEEKWKELDKLQEELKGGIKVESPKAATTKKASKKAIKKIVKTETTFV